MFSLRKLASALAVALWAATLLGSAAVADEPPEESPPVLSAFSATPSFLSAAGGEVTLSVRVDDNEGVSSVGASVYLAEGGTLGTALSPASVDDQGVGTYSGTVVIPANFTDSQVSHTVEVSAADSLGAGALEIMGNIDVDAQPQFDERPAVSDPEVTPTALPAEGGLVTIAATATDNRSVSEVFAVVTDPAGGETTATMDPVSATRFQGTWTAPANSGSADATYTLTVTAYDDIGQADQVSAASVVVAGRATPSRLVLSSRALFFGRVAPGHRAVRPLRLTNTGGSTSLSGLLRLRHGPFRIVGSGGRPVAFTLPAGGSKTYAVRFAPQRPGARARLLRVVRDDGRQPRLAAILVGRAPRSR